MTNVINDKYHLTRVEEPTISHNYDKIIINGYGITHGHNGVLIGKIEDSTFKTEFRDAWVGNSTSNPEIPRVQHALAVRQLDCLQWVIDDSDYICASYKFEANAGVGTWKEYEISNFEQSKSIRVIDTSDEPFIKPADHLVTVIWRFKRLEN